MKKALIIFILCIAFTAQVFAQEGAPKQGEEDASIGLSFGIDYYSRYIWRGIDFYDGDGYFYPSISWDIFETGLTLSVAGEIASSWVFNGFTKKPNKYYYEDWTLSTLYKKKKQMNSYAYANQGLDFGIEYSYTFENIITLGANFWYYWYFNSKNAREMAWTTYESLNMVKKWDTSYFSAGVSVGLDCVPWINPTIAVTYDNYIGYERSGDYYLQFGFSHDFEVVKDVFTITPAITAGYYWGRTYGYNNWYLASPDGVDFALADDIPWRDHVASKNGVSDIVPSVSATVTHGGFSFTSGFFYVIVPAKSWYKGGPIHKFYAQLGMSYSL